MNTCNRGLGELFCSHKINVQDLSFFSSFPACRLAYRKENKLHKTASESDTLMVFTPFLERIIDPYCKDILREFYSAPLGVNNTGQNYITRNYQCITSTR
jgi:hypothetical protein